MTSGLVNLQVRQTELTKDRGQWPSAGRSSRSAGCGAPRLPAGKRWNLACTTYAITPSSRGVRGDSVLATQNHQDALREGVIVVGGAWPKTVNDRLECMPCASSCGWRKTSQGSCVRVCRLCRNERETGLEGFDAALHVSSCE